MAISERKFLQATSDFKKRLQALCRPEYPKVYLNGNELDGSTLSDIYGFVSVGSQEMALGLAQRCIPTRQTIIGLPESCRQPLNYPTGTNLSC